MKQPEITYIKREVKKVLPVLIAGILYTALIFGNLFVRLKNICLDGYLTFSWPNDFSGREFGDSFIHTWLEIKGDLHIFVMIFMEAFLIRRIFYQENRAGISDFLRILPIKEWKKTWIKVGVGESVIFVFCLVHGLTATLVNSIYAYRLNEINSMMPGAKSGDTYLFIWQIILLMFVGMSVMFLVLFVAQLYIHNTATAYFVGTGILGSPFYFTGIYSLLYHRHGGDQNWMIPYSMVDPFPQWDTYFLNSNSDTVTMVKYTAYWVGYSQKLLFLFLFLILAAAVILLALKKRWNVWESNNALVNSKVVMEFIFAGLSLGLGTVAVIFLGNVFPVGFHTEYEEFIFWLYSVIAGGIILLFLNAVVMMVERKRRNGR